MHVLKVLVSHDTETIKKTHKRGDGSNEKNFVRELSNDAGFEHFGNRSDKTILGTMFEPSIVIVKVTSV
jgi:hypothetical protein